MATFPSITPTYGQQKRSAPNTRTVRFADGYEHRILFGLAAHQNPKVYNFTFNVSETDADTIEGFLDSRANDSASFTFTPPGEGFTKTGTYSQSGTTVTITISSHGVAVGDESLLLITQLDLQLMVLFLLLRLLIQTSLLSLLLLVLPIVGMFQLLYLVLVNMFAKLGQNLYHITIEQQFKQHLERCLNHEQF